ncbi:MAG: ribonuclease III [Gammaproteobacteria bacterium]|nr:MAG: ribonuclease III [Gammaproteobacteria bacterium]
MKKSSDQLCEALGHFFTDTGLLSQALTHRSANASNNERLEFLGDAILNFSLTYELYSRFPEATEGELSRMRASLVQGETVASLAQDLNLGQHIELGLGERKSGGQRRNSILADAMEAVFGAILLDSDAETCKNLIIRLYQSRIDDLPSPEELKDPKTRLQEYLQARGLALPKYNLIQTSGAGHAQQFVIECRISLFDDAAVGEGSSRRKAEQDAAQKSLSRINS